MKVLKATLNQKNYIESQTKGNHIIKFSKDVNGNWVVSKTVLTSPHFTHLKNDLEQLEEIDYTLIT